MRRHIKTCISLLVLAILITQCKKSTVNPFEQLPPITTTGANTFGGILDNTALLPKSSSPSFTNPFPNPALDVLFSYEVNIKVGGGFYMCISLFDLYKTGEGIYEWNNTQYGGEAFPLYANQLYGSFFNSKTNKYEWYGSYVGSGKTIISKFDTTNHIISGTYSGKLKQRFGTEEITITDGRFDLNWTTASNKKFP